MTGSRRIAEIPDLEDAFSWSGSWLHNYFIEGELKKLGFGKLTKAFDAVFQSKQISVIRTPLEAPNAKPFAERWVRSVRQEMLAHVLCSTKRFSVVSSTLTSTTTTPDGRIRA